MNDFQIAVQFLVDSGDGFNAEGGYVNDPNDPGGETNYGISKASFPNEDIKKLTLQRAMEIYKEYFWDAYHLDMFERPLNIVLMDSYVQHRPSVVKEFIEFARGDWRRVIEARRAFYLRLIQKKPKMKKYKNGWMNRLNSLDKYCTIQLEQHRT